MSSRPAGISDDGNAVFGRMFAPGANPRDLTFRWTAQAGVEFLDASITDNSNQVLKPSADGSTIAIRRSSLFEHYVWTEEDGLHLFDDITFRVEDSPLAVSGNGDTIGGRVGPGLGVPARWHRESGVEELGLPQGVTSGTAVAVSGDGQSLIVSAGSLFRWTDLGGYESLGTISNHDRFAIHGVSTDGTVVTGVSGNGQGPNSLWRWTSDAGIEELETGSSEASFRPRRDTSGQGTLLSADGKVLIGERHNADFSSREAYRWTDEDGYEPMLLPGYARATAYDITPDGKWILGSSFGRLDDSLPEISLMLWSEDTGLLNLLDVLDEQGIGSAVADMDTLLGGPIPSLPHLSANGRAITGGGIGPSGLQEAWVVYLDPLVIPEPSSLLLSTLALAGVLTSRRRSSL